MFVKQQKTSPVKIRKCPKTEQVFEFSALEVANQ